MIGVSQNYSHIAFVSLLPKYFHSVPTLVPPNPSHFPFFIYASYQPLTSLFQSPLFTVPSQALEIWFDWENAWLDFLAKSSGCLRYYKFRFSNFVFLANVLNNSTFLTLHNKLFQKYTLPTSFSRLEKNRSFPYYAIYLLVKSCVRYIFASLFLSPKDSTCDIWKNVFLNHFKSSNSSREIQSWEF